MNRQLLSNCAILYRYLPRSPLHLTSYAQYLAANSNMRLVSCHSRAKQYWLGRTGQTVDKNLHISTIGYDNSRYPIDVRTWIRSWPLIIGLVSFACTPILQHVWWWGGDGGGRVICVLVIRTISRAFVLSIANLIWSTTCRYSLSASSNWHLLISIRYLFVSDQQSISIV